VKTAEIRKTFLDFYAKRDHRVVASSSLIPNDPTLLLTTAGMVQFKPYFLGQKTPEFPRAASVQKSARTSDIEIVGLTARHMTFFEMLGNFSFGDYYKREACAWAWELVTEHFGLDPARLWVTIFSTDDEAYEAWRNGVGVRADRIVRRGAPDNFWDMTAAGPCGPCSEIFYDRGPAYGEVEGFEDGDRIVEFYNLVFMESERDDAGNIVGKLPSRNVDTGMGLERAAAILQDVPGIFETDAFRPILARAEERTGRRYGARYGDDAGTDVSLRILAEHARAASFLVADGVFPSNEGRGYVLRRLIRRAVRHARMLGVEDPIVAPLAEVVIEEYGDAYPELSGGRAHVVQVLEAEEESFRRTLGRGLAMLEDEMKRSAGAALDGGTAFKLHDTYGFPLELTTEIVAEAGMQVDRAEFERLMDSQRERARKARAAPVEAAGEESYRAVHAERGPTKFLGYSTTEADAVVVALVRGGDRVPAVSEGEDVDVFLEATPFYAEAGGQVGDRGVITADGAVIEVLDAQHVLGDLIAHRGRVRSGEIRAGTEARVAVDRDRRAAIMRSHTATHIVHQTLKEVLGAHARQAGSLVDAGRLRFDFPHPQAVPRELLAQAEEVVNSRVVGDAPVRPYETTQEYARQIGAVALFGEKYGDIVRVVEVGDYSVELCGGTHVAHTSQVGAVKILGEASIGANLRRIEALTGAEAIEGWRRSSAVLEQVAALLRSAPEEAPDRIERMLEELNRAEAAVASVRKAEQKGAAEQLARRGSRVGDSLLVVAEQPGLGVDELQKLAVATRDAAGGPAIVVLAAASDGRAGIVAAVTKDLASRGISAKGLIAEAAKAIGGGAGGKDQVATGGGGRAGGVGEALRLAEAAARGALGA
jgi:alanyl-tRNA synthetase